MLLQVGKVFLGRQDQKRIRLQSKWEKLYHSEFIHQIIVDKGGSRRAVDPLIPLANTVSEIFADLLFLEFPKINFDKDAIDKELVPLIDSLKIDLLEAAGLNSATGMLFWVLFKKDGKTFWRFKSPTEVQWQKDFTDELTMVRLFKQIEVKGQNLTFFIQEWNLNLFGEGEDTFKRAIIEEYEVVVRASDHEVIRVMAVDAKDTGLPFIPVIEIQNIGQMNSPIGKSDYQGKEQLFAEVDNRVDQNNSVLQEQSEPWVGLPSGVLDEAGNFNRKNGKWFQKGMSGNQADNEVSVVTWDASLTASFEQIKLMVRQILFTTRISSPIAGFEEGATVESGTALKWRSINTFSSLGRRRIYWEQAIKKFLLYYSQMTEGATDLTEALDTVKIEWQDSLPMDDDSATDNVVKKVNAKVQSRLKAIMNLNEADRKNAQEELDQIDTEAVTEADIQGRQFTGNVTL